MQCIVICLGDPREGYVMASHRLFSPQDARTFANRLALGRFPLVVELTDIEADNYKNNVSPRRHG